jgi:hypothetical protein
VATAVYDVFRQHEASVVSTGRELESQAVDVVPRHFVDQFRGAR